LTCVRNAALCGDGSVDPGEECDDGNVVGRDGCESDCRFSCHADEECDDRDPCTADSCRATAAGRRCDNTPTAGLPCSDGNPCTEPDTCMLDPGGSARCAGGPNHCACVTTVDCAALEDGDLCNGTLVCIDGVCAVDPATVVMCDPTADTLCARNLCEPTTGRCRMQAGADGRPCDDGDWCTLTDRCEGGECVGSGARCTLACQVCNRASFTCDVAPGYCIVDDACVPEFDAARPDPRARNPENPCQGCRPAVDPVGWSDLPPGVDCNDGVWCNGNETCDGSGTCAAGAPPCPVGGCVGGVRRGARPLRARVEHHRLPAFGRPLRRARTLRRHQPHLPPRQIPAGDLHMPPRGGTVRCGRNMHGKVGRLPIGRVPAGDLRMPPRGGTVRCGRVVHGKLACLPRERLDA